MTVRGKIKTINIKIRQNKAQYDYETARISALTPGNIDKYEFLKGQEILPEKGVLKKAATIKKFECLTLGSEVKKQADIAKKRYQGLSI